MKRDGFIIHEKTLQQIRRLDPEDCCYLLACMTEYYYNGTIDIDNVETVSVAVAVILDDAIERMAADAEAYEKSVEQRKKAAEKRWENASGMRNDATACDRMRDDAKVCEGDAKNAVSVSVSDSVSVKDKKNRRFTPPSVEEVRAYCAERKNGIDAEAFIAFYESKGWKVGNAPMKNWKSAVVTWEKRQRPPNKFANFPQREDIEHKELISRVIAMQ